MAKILPISHIPAAEESEFGSTAMPFCIVSVVANVNVRPETSLRTWALTVVRLPEVHERPVEPDLALFDVVLRSRSGRRPLVTLMVHHWGAGERQHEVVGSDRLKAVVVPQVRDAPREHVDAEPCQDGVDGRTVYMSVSSTDRGRKEQRTGSPRQVRG